MSGEQTSSDLGWHVLHGDDLLVALRRCQAGEDADLVYAELWANAEHEQVPAARPTCTVCGQVVPPRVGIVPSRTSDGYDHETCRFPSDAARSQS